MTDTALVEKAHALIENHPEIYRSLAGYAREIGVDVDHVILGALQMVAQDYDRATGQGMIPCLGA